MRIRDRHRPTGRCLPTVLAVTLVACASAVSAGARSASPLPTGPYFGQTLPGDTPEVFAPGFVSTDAHEFGCSFTPDGKEFYFSRRVGDHRNPTLIMVSRCVDGTWNEPEAAPFNSPAARMSFEPMVTPDGRRLYFSSDMALPSHPQVGGRPQLNLWFVERTGNGWGESRDAGGPFNPMHAMYVSMTSAGTIYTTDISGGPGSERIAVSRRVDGIYGALEILGAPINGGVARMYPYVAPDESYLIVSSGQGPLKTLLISYREADGTWGEPRAIDLGMPAGAAVVSPDGLYLFFTGGERGKGDIYWVSTSALNR